MCSIPHLWFSEVLPEKFEVLSSTILELREEIKAMCSKVKDQPEDHESQVKLPFSADLNSIHLPMLNYVLTAGPRQLFTLRQKASYFFSSPDLSQV